MPTKANKLYLKAAIWFADLGELVLNYSMQSFSLVFPGPSSPFIEKVDPILGGLNISWRTDVTSKQEKYMVIYTRNDTGKDVRIQTPVKSASLTNLYPGAGYKIQVTINS